MISQNLINEYIPGAVNTFKKVMPPISTPYPIIRIASAETLKSVRSELVELTGSTSSSNTAPFKSVMETFHGDKGDAILIYQKNCPEDQDEFNHFLWHELGHFYSIANDVNNLHHLINEELSVGEANLRHIGYWFWCEFVAESISNYVEEKACPIDKETIKTNWRKIYGRIQYLIQLSNSHSEYSFNEYDLAFFYATVLTNQSALAFIDLSLNDKIEVRDPYAFNLIPKDFQPYLLKILYLLIDKVNEEPFWIIDGEFLVRLGQIIRELNYKKTSIACMYGSKPHFTPTPE